MRFLLIPLLLSTLAHAAVLTGTVLDLDASPIGGVGVRLSGSPTIAQVFSDDQGRWTLNTATPTRVSRSRDQTAPTAGSLTESEGRLSLHFGSALANGRRIQAEALRPGVAIAPRSGAVSTTDTLLFTLRNRLLARIAVSLDSSSTIAVRFDTALSRPRTSPAPGTYADVTLVRPTTTIPFATLRCTVDGTLPTDVSPVCSTAITIGKTTILRSLAIAPDGQTSPSSIDTFAIRPHVADTGLIEENMGRAAYRINGSEYVLSNGAWNSAGQHMAYGPGGTILTKQASTSFAWNVSSPCIRRTGYDTAYSKNSGLPSARALKGPTWVGWRHEGFAENIAGSWEPYLLIQADSTAPAYATSGTRNETRVYLGLPFLSRIPRDSLLARDIRLPGLPGSWTLYGKIQDDQRILTWLPDRKLSEVAFDVGALVSFQRELLKDVPGYVHTLPNLYAVSACTDIWQGGVGLRTSAFSVRLP